MVKPEAVDWQSTGADARMDNGRSLGWGGEGVSWHTTLWAHQAGIMTTGGVISIL